MMSLQIIKVCPYTDFTWLFPVSDARDLRRSNYGFGMNEEQVRSMLNQLGMFVLKKAEEDLSTDFPTTEWMSAWETKSSDGVNIILAVLLTEHTSDVTLLKNKMNEFAAGAKIEFKGLFDMEKE